MIRVLKSGMIVRHFKGDIYRIIDIGVHTETNERMVIYCKDDNGLIWVSPYTLFEGRVDKSRYPNSNQTYKFEIIEENQGVL